MANPAGDVIGVLTQDHREVEEFFDELRGTVTEAVEVRGRIVTDVIIALARHALAEEMYLYPAARRYIPGGGQIVDKQIEDHVQIEKILKHLERTDPADAEFSALINHLMHQVRRHIADEEDHLLPQLAEHSDPDLLVCLGERVHTAKSTVPTRPHPDAPDRPALNRLLAPGLGLVDRTRAYLTRHGHL